MKRRQYRQFSREGGSTFTLQISPPLSIQTEQAAAAESRSYKEVSRRAIEEYVSSHQPGLLRKVAHDA
jgi:hypothetical protein